MAVNYIENEDMEKALYCSTTMQAFGPIFYEDEDVEDFLEWLPKDARTYDDGELIDKRYEWKADVIKQREEEDSLI